ncbi:hypothetical protein ASPVEDRAFT_86931 [Aspergillus versicolor CBS 583.65]|uniref:Ecp2 effector protein domain-containing protein n=1 Tax=Aspergillus versicolor CBS 583.65 TaxID=1036611 RepID=A0A1L9PVN3_ASPVE|nr:uncharacterized protein ASPVEDRAFT_86931 [Aspergillus versicolor CBS 583.65]OJJ05587.1 hypothetical protein ASPVEDRAFT_86931 [Aspergillus versicolor CBS 583.65]
MRVNTVISSIAMLTTAVSGHSVNCWGKALHPDFHTLRQALGAVENGPDSAKADANSCTKVFCGRDMSIRYCNEGDKTRTMPMQNIMDSVKVIAHDCKTEYDGETVAGGVVDHPDHWSVVVQTEDDDCGYYGWDEYPLADL